jgi:hypothetical protein
MWLTIKFHNFLRSTSSILIDSTSEAVYKIWISNLKTSHEFFNDKMISNKKIANYKVLLHFKTYNFYFDGIFIRVSLKILNLKFKHSFAWQDDFKPKHCQLQSFITLQYLQLSCWWFFFRGRFQNLNFNCFKFRRSFRWQDDFKWKSCQLQNSITCQDLQSLFWLFGHLFISHDGSNNMHKSYTSLVVS